MTEQDYKTKYETLIRILNRDSGLGVYPLGHMKHEERDKAKTTDEYKCGWDDAVLATTKKLTEITEILETAEKGVDEDLALLLAADGYVFYSEENELMLNMNDTWAWALSWCPIVPPDQIPEVARLFRTYGNAGLMYWHSCQENNMRSEFEDNNRAIDFIRHEEKIRKNEPDHNKRAYLKIKYTLGEEINQPAPTTGEVKKPWYKHIFFGS